MLADSKYIYESFQFEEYMLPFLESVLSTKWDGDKRDIVFLGDSIIRDYDLSRFFPKIKTKLFNCGVSGITTEGLFNIIKQGVVRHNPKGVVILVGTNDMSRESDKRNSEIISNIARLVSELKIILDGVKIVLISILPCDEARYGKDSIGKGSRSNARIMEINKTLKDFEKYYNDCIFVDAFKELSDSTGNLINSYTHDGIHLTVKGYDILTSILTPIIEKLLKND